MKTKSPNRISVAHAEDVASSQSEEDLEDLDDVTVAGPIGVKGQPSLEEWR
jgi:hypothetical protein